ncbi:MAG: hypothetical protein IKO94_01195 [Selenomonadaceae bacterium]|nr:capsid protein [Clostridia bacterium]MBR4694679.1 hypothetical protein [Selenomonadaceae bacterium]
MAALNYVTEYAQALVQAYPYVLHFGALYSTPNNGRFRWTGAKTIEIPSLSTTGRVDANRDTIALAQRNYDNSWEPKTLSNQRKWSTLVHPMDIDQTNGVATINNITATFNNEQKFPEMDAYCISKIFSDWVTAGESADTTVPSVSNILSIFDQFMQQMDEARVPVNGRILYVIPAIATMLKNAQAIQRQFDVQSGSPAINRIVNSLDNVKIEVVPPELMKTAYNFTSGWTPGTTAKQIYMVLIDPMAVITPVSYQFAQLDEPAAGSEGKYIYYEESFEDVFILNKRAKGIKFLVAAEDESLDTITVASAAGTASGDTKLTLTGYTPKSGESYVYKIGDTAAPTIGWHEVPDYSWTPWNGTADITAANGKKIAVVSVNASGQAEAYGSATVVNNH